MSRLTFQRLNLFSHSVLSYSLGPPWTAALQAPQSMGFSRQGYWSGLPFLSLEDLLNLGTEPESLVSPALQTVLYPLSHHWFKFRWMPDSRLTTFLWGKWSNVAKMWSWWLAETWTPLDALPMPCPRPYRGGLSELCCHGKLPSLLRGPRMTLAVSYSSAPSSPRWTWAVCFMRTEPLILRLKTVAEGLL